MRRCMLVALAFVFVFSPFTAPTISGARLLSRSAEQRADMPLVVRPGMLAAQIGELAGHAVRVPYARVVGVFNPRVFLIDTATRLQPIAGLRERVVVLLEHGSLGVTESMIVASTVTIRGVARTVVGMQASREVEWPPELRPEEVERLEIKAAILASSVQSPEGVELTRGTQPQP